MVNKVSTVEICCGSLYGAVSTRVGRRESERSGGVLAFIFCKGVVPIKWRGLGVLWGKGGLPSSTVTIMVSWIVVGSCCCYYC